MQTGVIYPQTELGGSPAALGAIGQAAEELGYDYLLMFDHVVGVSREGREAALMALYSDKDPFHDPLVAFAYLSGLTKRLGFATGVLVLPQRPTALVARQAADVDLVSGGRLRLGVGVGWNPIEYQALGQDYHRRGKRLDEQIPLLRSLWTESSLDFKGQFDRIDQAGINPRPTRSIPIWCGGSSEAAFRRAARLADGFIFSGPFEERILPGWRALQGYLEEEGRSAADFGAEYLVSESMTVEATVDLIRRWEDAGGTHAGVRTMGLGFTEPQQHIDYLAAVIHRLG